MVTLVPEPGDLIAQRKRPEACGIDAPTPGGKNCRAREFEYPLAKMQPFFKTGPLSLIGFRKGGRTILRQSPNTGSHPYLLRR
jgi:hypothetical protein